MPITPTHIATNKKNGRKVLVEFDNESGKYRESFMVDLIESHWDIQPITPPTGAGEL